MNEYGDSEDSFDFTLAGIPPHRLAGVEPIGILPVAPEPAIEVPVDDVEDEEFLEWQASWGGTRPEYVAFRWLERHGFEPDADFAYQSSRMGGRQMFGGTVVDFDFPSLLLAWRIQGEHWHIGDPAKEANDAIQKLSLSQYGYTVVDVFAQDVLQRPDWVLGNAIQGVQVRSLHGNV